VKDPSWSELYHFVSFLNRQLQDFETSAFCSPLLKDDLPRFYNFVLDFMIQMSRVSKKLEYLNLNMITNFIQRTKKYLLHIAPPTPIDISIFNKCFMTYDITNETEAFVIMLQNHDHMWVLLSEYLKLNGSGLISAKLIF